MAKIDLTKYAAMVANAASQVKISSTIFKNFIADIKSVIDGNDDEFIAHLADKSPHTVPTCRVFNDSVQAVPNNTLKTLAFNGELYDTDTMHDTVTNNSRITIKTSGKYKLCANIEIQMNASGSRNVSFFANGTTFIGSTRVIGNGVSEVLINLTAEYIFTAGDYIEVTVYQDSGSSLNVSASDSLNRYKCEFMASFISA